MRTPRLTFGQFVGVTFCGVAGVLALLLSVFYAGTRSTILLASRDLMRQASRRVTERLDDHLAEAERLVATIETQAALGLVTEDSVESVLLGGLGGHPDVADVSLTYGRAVGTYDRDEPPHDAGDLRLAADGAGQVSIARATAREGGTMMIRRLTQAADGWRAVATWVAPDGTRTVAETPPGVSPPIVADPTLHPTFTTPSRSEFRGRALWSDLAFYENDAGLPEDERRRVVSVQKALWTPAGDFHGVVRVALRSERIDELTRIRVDDANPNDDHVVFLCDDFGRLLSRLHAADHFGLLDVFGRADPDGDVRVVPATLPPAIAAALAATAAGDAPGGDVVVRRLDVDRVPYLASIAAVLGERTRGWRVGIVVPEAHYLGALAASRNRALAGAAALMLAAVVGAALALRAIRRDLGRLIGETTRLRGFDFTPSSSAGATFRDVQDASQSLEQAKTALRALGKYAPLDLVRDLYDGQREPTLGAELTDVTILFADVAGFTTLAEALDPDTLALALGAYLDAMTRAIHATGGIIDKYIGDGVMALWNTPRPVAHHAVRACEAALACVAATDALFRSPAWHGREPWRTRFGIHRADVTVGHFGAPDRMSFTAMGDGVNLAARLESLGKQYGTALLVSDVVEREARTGFWFRRLDRVAVKGRAMGVEIYELLGRRDAGTPAPAIVAPYESALAAYFAGDFAGALAAFDAWPDDPPSRVMAARCRAFLATPPAPDWNGIFVATSK
jgi:adenylate cyclase